MIRLHSVVKRFGAQEVLQGVSMSVARGEVCVLLGPSGGGKSTLLRTVNGLESFHGGYIEVGGTHLTWESGAAREAALLQIRRRIGMVFQQFNLFPHKSVLENVIEAPMHVLKQSRDQAIVKAREILSRVGMIAKCDAKPAALSGGQQQRVAIARTLAMQPDAILFDEPTSALDPSTTAEIVSIMQDLAKSGQGMIVVTHGMHFARTVGHTVHILHSGNIIESGPPRQVFENPQHDLTKQFVADCGR